MYHAQIDIQAIRKQIEEQPAASNDVWVLFLAEKDHQHADRLRQLFLELQISFFGGLFPQVVSGLGAYDEGLVLKQFSCKGPIQILEKISSQPTFQLPPYTEEGQDEEGTALVLVDGLTSNISHFLSQVFDQLGRTVKYLGGGAGSISLEQAPCLITAQGILKDAAIITYLDCHAELGVRHGWKDIYGPLVATSTEANVIRELNWNKAFDIYREVVEQHTGEALREEAFFDTSKGFPFGMTKVNAEAVVRDPIAVNDKGELICVGEVPENTIINVLEGKPESLIAAAAQAARDCQSENAGTVKDCLIFDCISRVLFLEDDFHKELAAVQQNLPQTTPPLMNEGALTLGEISSNGHGLLEFFNKTIVMGLLYEKNGAAP
ncbi:MAG: FIST signal transduction protein [Salibacteraceae bacterium]